MSANYVRIEGRIINVFKNLKTTRMLVKCLDFYGNTVPCIVFDDSSVKRYVDEFNKGDGVVIEGYIKVSSYVNKQGVKIASIEIVILSISKSVEELESLTISYDWINDCERK